MPTSLNQKTLKFLENTCIFCQPWWLEAVSPGHWDVTVVERGEEVVAVLPYVFKLRFGKYRLLAKYDLIALQDGTAIIYDWKTYRKRPRNEWLAARMQTRVYRALLVNAGAHLNGGKPFEPEQIEMIYWFADFPEEPARFPYTTTQFTRDWDLLVKLSEEVASASSYLLTEGRQKCAFCIYRSYCERGVRAGDNEQAEAEMEAEELFDVNFEQIGEIAF